MANRPGMKKRAPRPAPIVQRELHTLLHPSFQQPAAVIEACDPSLMDRLSAWVRSVGSRLIRFRAPRGRKA